MVDSKPLQHVYWTLNKFYRKQVMSFAVSFYSASLIENFVCFLLLIESFLLASKASRINYNSSRSDPRRIEKINWNFYFRTSLWCLKRFYQTWKAFIKPFEAPQRSLRVKISVNLSEMHGAGRFKHSVIVTAVIQVVFALPYFF